MTEALAPLPITSAASAVAYLPLAAVAIPLLGALIVALLGRRERLRLGAAIASCAAAFLAVAAMYGPVYKGIEVGGEALKGIALALPGLFATGLTFRVDPTGFLVALVTSAIYTLGVIFGTSYMQGEHARTRYDTFLLLTLAANLGVLLAGDFGSLFVFFEMMALASYVIVIHGQNPQSMKAGRLYLYMSVAGGLVLLGGIAALAGLTGSLAMVPGGHALEGLTGWLALGIPLAMIVGFGTKAGLFLLHVWLPEAHPVAPSPASALLSGLMVKVGVYGILRTANVLLIPGAEAGGHLMHTVGLVLIGAGVVTLVVGMVNASFCSNCKELLAYSTISQVGYIVLGLGCAAYLGADGAVAMTGALLHVVNHAVFKALFFLAVGAVIWRAKEQHFSRLGGMAYKMPFTAAAAFLAMLSITGVPGTAGFASKSILHHAVLEVINESVKLTGGPDWRFLVVEALFVGAAAGTFAYSSRMFILVFLGKAPSHLKDVKPETWAMRIAYLPLMAAIVVIGILPNWFISRFIGPALGSFGFDPRAEAYRALYDVATGVSALPILYDPLHLAAPITNLVTENLIAIGSSVFFAGTFFLVGHKIGIFDMPLPEWLSLAYWYRRLSRGLVAWVSAGGRALDAVWDKAVWALFVTPWLARPRLGPPKEPVVLPWVARGLGHLAAWTSIAEHLLDRALSFAFVDAWITEEAAPPPPHRMAGLASRAAYVDHLVDVAISTAMVDVWLPMPAQPGMAGTAAPAPLPVVSAGAAAGLVGVAKAESIWDRLLSLSMVDSWLPGPIVPGDEAGEAEERPAARPARRQRPAGGFTLGRGSGFWWAMAWRAALLLIGLTVIWLTIEIASGHLTVL